MISIVVCTDIAGGIGKDNDLLFHIKKDMKRFKDLTVGHKVIMGRKTFDSLPSMLPEREHIIITKNPPNPLYHPHIKPMLENHKNGWNTIPFTFTWDIQRLIDMYKDSEEEVFVIGGESIYTKFLPHCSKIYLTKVYERRGADKYFEFEYTDEFKCVSLQYFCVLEAHGLSYVFYDLERKEA